MKESQFVKQNAEKWQEYESEPTHDPDVLAKRYIEITDDLSFAKTFYPTSATTVYLNGLAAGFHLKIYKNKEERSNRFITFWKTELPLIFGIYRKTILYSALFFIVFCLIGALSAKHEPDFVELIMGEQYVNMTKANIAKGDPFGVYKQSEPFTMFFMIAFNNVKVSFVMFALGLLFSVGSIWMSLRTGLMLGSFQYFFFSQGLGVESVLVIWIHGTLEISSCVIACAAGLVMGNSILFPGTYSRLRSFQRGAKAGMKMIIGLVPVFIVAAVLESFVTRHTEMPAWLSVFILGFSAVFIAWYVVIYPTRLVRKSNLTLYDEF